MTKYKIKYLFFILLTIVASCKVKTKEEVKVQDAITEAANAIEAGIENDFPGKFNLLDTVFKNINIKKENCKTSLIAIQFNNNNPEETFVVIPEIVEGTSNYLELKGHILVVNSKTGAIIFKYSESNNWTSDAIELKEIEIIDSESYFIANNTRTFGIKLYYSGSSYANPYSNKTMSLFIKTGDTLQKILSDFDEFKFHGKRDSECVEELWEEKKSLIEIKEQTNGFYDILVKNIITNTKITEGNGGTKDCDVKEKITLETSLLKFNGKTYTEHEYKGSIFKTLINNILLKNTPLIDTTNYDNFKETNFYNIEEVLSLQLEKIYPNFYKEDSHYKAASSYKLTILNNFYSVVFTIFKGENEMESILINYDLRGNLIDYKVISYDEMAEGWSRIESKIKENILTVNNINWINGKQQTLEVFEIDVTGKFKRFDAGTDNSETLSSILIESVIQQLDLDKLTLKNEFITAKILPHNKNEIIVVLPEIEGEDDENIYRLNSYIAIADVDSGEVTHKYFESSKTSGWESDAIMLSEITIDTTVYQLNKNTKSFGVQVYNYGLSRVNPYNKRTLSLFMKLGDSLKKVLHHYDILSSRGKWDDVCAGESTEVKNTFHISKNQSNGYKNIIVKNAITKRKTFLDENGDCDSKDNISNQTTTLKFDGKTYH